MTLNHHQIEGLKEIGIEADNTLTAIEAIVDKYKVWGYVDYMFKEERFFWVIQSKVRTTSNFTEIFQKDTSPTLYDSTTKLIDELIKTVKQKKNQ